MKRSFNKILFGVGIFITFFGIGSVTEEIHGCLVCPLDGFLYWMGLTSQALSFLKDICWYTIATGMATILLSIMLSAVKKEPLFKKINFKFPKLKPWKKRRLFFALLVYFLIVVHITLTTLGLTNLKSICPRSLGDLILHGKFGTSSVFWLVMLSLVFVWGRGLCGWFCVFAPVQEQSTNLLKACGNDPGKRKYKFSSLIYLTTAVLWSSILYYIFKNRNHLDFNVFYGYKVASYWIFLGGLVTTIPLTMYITYFFGNRWFCKYLCPIGGLQSLYAKLSLFKVKIDKSKCINCSACTRSCQMSVNIDTYINENGTSISDRNCIMCGDCIDSCPKHALKFGFAGFKKVTEQQKPLTTEKAS